MNGAAVPAGMVRVMRDAMPMTIRVELDDAAADALGWPPVVAVDVAGAVVTVTPADRGRSTWRGRTGRAALCCTVRAAVRADMLGRWPAVLDGDVLVIDTAGRTGARRAA